MDCYARCTMEGYYWDSSYNRTISTDGLVGYFKPKNNLRSHLPNQGMKPTTWHLSSCVNTTIIQGDKIQTRLMLIFIDCNCLWLTGILVSLFWKTRYVLALGSLMVDGWRKLENWALFPPWPDQACPLHRCNTRVTSTVIQKNALGHTQTWYLSSLRSKKLIRLRFGAIPNWLSSRVEWRK